MKRNESEGKPNIEVQELVVLNDDEVLQSISMQDAVKVVGDAFAQLHTKDAQVPLRTLIPSGDTGATLFMPARLPKTEALGIKLVSVRSNNAKKGLPTVPAVVLLLDESTGLPIALIQATQLTALRTAAGSAVATHHLAKRDARVMVVFGAGEQARAHIEAILTVRRSIKEVYIINRTKSTALELQQHYQAAVGHGYTEITWRVVEKDSEEEREAVQKADVIVTATNSSTPLFQGQHLKPGVHINAIGSYTPAMQELDETTVQKAKIVVDDREAALKEAGDLVVPLQKGLISLSSIVADLGQVVAEEMEVRQSDEDITLFKSVGSAVQDVSVARAVYLAAHKRGLGQRVPFGPALARI